MTRREYIGARYLPLYGRSGEADNIFDNSKPYEPFTIVYYEGASYISRTFVPTGIAITNTQYWALFSAETEVANQALQKANEALDEIDTINETTIPAIEDMIPDLPLSIENGGTGATTKQQAKGNLNIGTSAMDFKITNSSASKRLFVFNTIVQNQYSDYYQKNVAMAPRDDGIILYDITGGNTVAWQLYQISDNVEMHPIFADENNSGNSSRNYTIKTIGTNESNTETYGKELSLRIINQGLALLNTTDNTTLFSIVGSTRNTIADIITPASNITINSINVCMVHLIAFIEVSFTPTTTISDGSTKTIGTLTTNYRPKFQSSICARSIIGDIRVNGEIRLRANGIEMSANSEYKIGGCYVMDYSKRYAIT